MAQADHLDALGAAADARRAQVAGHRVFAVEGVEGIRHAVEDVPEHTQVNFSLLVLETSPEGDNLVEAGV